MPASRAVRDFVGQARDLLRVLEREGHKLSDIDLHTLIMHLHLLEIKSTNIVTSKKTTVQRAGCMNVLRLIQFTPLQLFK